MTDSADTAFQKPAQEAEQAAQPQEQNKKNLDLLFNWYQSYYLWSITSSHFALTNPFMPLASSCYNRRILLNFIIRFGYLLYF